MTAAEQIDLLKSALIEVEHVTIDHPLFNQEIFDAIVDRDDYDPACAIGGDEATFSIIAAECRIALNKCGQ